MASAAQEREQLLVLVVRLEMAGGAGLESRPVIPVPPVRTERTLLPKLCDVM